MAAEDLILRMRVENGRVAAREVENVGGALGRTEERARRAHRGILGFSSGLGGLRRIIGTVTGVVGIGGLALGFGEMLKNAQGFQDASKQLANAIRHNIKGPTQEALNTMKEFADRLAVSGGFAPPDELKSLTMLARVTHSTSKTLKDMTIATDVARGAHRSLTQATRAVMMVEAGRTTGLTRLGIIIPKHMSAVRALAYLQKQYAGATTSYNNTAQGAMNNFMHAIDLAGEHIGMLFLPPLTKAFNWLAKFVGKLMDHNSGPGKVFHVIIHTAGSVLGALGSVLKSVISALGWLVNGWKSNKTAAVVVMGVLAALMAMGIAGWLVNVVRGVRAWVAGQWLLNAALTANPIGIVIAAIAALVGALVVVYLKVKGFRDIVNAVFSWLKGAVIAVVGFVSKHWELLGVILAGPFGVAALFIVRHFQDIKATIVDILNWIIDRANSMIDALNSVTSSIPIIGGNVLSRIGHIGGGTQALAASRFNDAAQTAAGKDPHRGHRWMGGPITHAGMYDVGEHGKETVYLPAGSHVDPHDHNAIGAAVAKALDGAAVNIDGRRAGQLLVRQGKLQSARQ